MVVVLLIPKPTSSYDFGYDYIDFLGILKIFKSGDPIELLQTCANCSYINITMVTAPNSSIILSDVEMDKSGVRFNYTLNPQQSIGTYQVCGYGDPDGYNEIWCYGFEITITGSRPSIAQGLIFVILLLVSSMAFITMIFIAFNIDDERFNMDSITGKVIGINWKRYYKNGCIIMAYALAIWISHLGRSIAENFLNSTSLAIFFKTIFYILMGLAAPLLVMYTVMFFVSFITDKKTQKLLDRGLQP